MPSVSQASPMLRQRARLVSALDGRWLDQGVLLAFASLSSVWTAPRAIFKDVSELENVRYFVHKIQMHLRNNEGVCNDFKDPFLEYKALWTHDIDESLSMFLTDNAEEIPKDEELDEQAAEELANGPLAVKPEPPLSMFDSRSPST